MTTSIAATPGPPEQPTLLVIDDEIHIRRAVRNALRDLTEQVLEVSTGREGIDQAAAAMPDLIVLDLGLPDMPGADVCREVRQWGTMPIVVLSARHAGADVVITVSDDGRGIDRDKVRARAESQGLLAAGAQVSDAELLQMIFQPGFSTAAKVTNLSGRGVGMDVVKRTVEGLRGAIEVSSPAGQGSQVSLRIPLTLAIIDGLLVRVGRGRYVIPLSAVEECVELSPEQDLRSTGRCLVSLRDQFVPYLRLREVFATGAPPDPHQKLVVVSTGEARVGLVVDQIVGDHQTVIKSLTKLHADVEMFSGATILGDGGVALILDVPHLVAAGQRQDAQWRRRFEGQAA